MVNLKTKPVMGSEMYCLSEFPSHWVCAKMNGSYMSDKKEGVPCTDMTLAPLFGKAMFILWV